MLIPHQFNRLNTQTRFLDFRDSSENVTMMLGDYLVPSTICSPPNFRLYSAESFSEVTRIDRRIVFALFKFFGPKGNTSGTYLVIYQV